MKRVELSEIKNIFEYEKLRNEYRKRIIDLKKKRRLFAGDRISFLFENHDTVLSQIQEMMRAERMVEDQVIQHEIDIYNGLLPDENELSATFFIEIIEEGEIKPWLDKLHGIDNGTCVWMEVENEKVFAIFEEGHSNEVKLSSVHYIRFRLSLKAKEIFCDPKKSVFLIVQHPAYQVKTEISGETRQQLIDDLIH